MSPEMERCVRDHIAALHHQSGALMPILHAIQHELGHIPSDAIVIIADALNLSRAEVHGVISFYDDFHEQAGQRHLLRLCRAESCQAMGADTIAAHLRDRLQTDDDGSNAEFGISLQTVYCLGACACSPALMLDGQLHGRVNNARVDELLNSCKERP